MIEPRFSIGIAGRKKIRRKKKFLAGKKTRIRRRRTVGTHVPTWSRARACVCVCGFLGVPEPVLAGKSNFEKTHADPSRSRPIRAADNGAAVAAHTLVRSLPRYRHRPSRPQVVQVGAPIPRAAVRVCVVPPVADLFPSHPSSSSSSSSSYILHIHNTRTHAHTSVCVCVCLCILYIQSDRLYVFYALIVS